MVKLILVMAFCGLTLGGCAGLGSGGGSGAASPDPADQSPNH